MTSEIRPGELDLAGIVRPGDTVLWGQGTGEPLTLTEALVEQRQRLGRVNVFLGPSFSMTLDPRHADCLSFRGFAGIGNNRRLAAAGCLDVLPCHLSRLPEYIATGLLSVEVVFVLVSPPDAEGRYSLGVVNDYLQPALERARVVVAEVNDQVPWTFCDGYLTRDRIDVLVQTSRPVLEVEPAPIGEVERAIAGHVGGLIPDGAVLQVGYGTIPDSVLPALAHHRDLGIHSGMINDRVLDLIEAGAVTNATKPIDRGITATGVLFGTRRLYDFAHRNPAVCLRPITYTHNADVLARIDRLVAVNSAVEVDLTGQVNAEVSGTDYLGAIGGQGDFVRAAIRSPGGRSIIALPASARSAAKSRIVSSLTAGLTTTPRGDADLVVTEFGVADLRGQTISERVRRMIAIADPALREPLEREARLLLGRAG